MDSTIEGVVALALVLEGVVLDVGGGGGVVVFKSGRGQDDDDDNEKVVKVLSLSLSKGGAGEVNDEHDFAVGSVNEKGGEG